MSRLHASEFGNPRDTPLVFMHGFPGSHTQGSFLHPHANRFKIRVISVDRPGYGHTPHTISSIEEFLDELAVLLKKKNVDKFYLIGVSGGNFYAMSAAARFSNRVLGLGSVCGVAPVDSGAFSGLHKNGLLLAQALPERLLGSLLSSFVKLVPGELHLKLMRGYLSAADKKIIESPAFRQTLLTTMTEARFQGSAGMVIDLKNFSSPWTLDFKKIRCPHFIWHGKEDKILSYEMAHYLKEKIPHAQLKIFPKEGHYSLPVERLPEILEDLIR